MKLGFGLMISILGTVLWTAAMYGVNQYTSAMPRTPAVAGVQTEVKELKFVPTTTTALTESVNEYRNLKRVAPVVEDARLNALAQERLADMQVNHYYAHKTLSGGNFADSFRSYDIPSDTYSCENLLLTSTRDVRSFITEWDESPAHAACMQNDAMTRVGVAEGVFDEQTGQRLVITIFAQDI